MTGALSVGVASTVTWDLLVPQSIDIDGYHETISHVRFRFTVRPTSHRDIVLGGRTIRRFAWSGPPAHSTIHVTQSFRVAVRSELAPFRAVDRYPLAPLPADVQPYLVVTPALHLGEAAARLAAHLARHKATEGRVVNAVANWVASHFAYHSENSGASYRAQWVFDHHVANCRGFADLMAGLLRRLGIPAQVEYGWVSSVPIQLVDSAHRTTVIQWSTPGSPGESHVWLNVYFPRSGWVPFDPRLEKFFVDSRHFAFATTVDAANLDIGGWRAVGPQSGAATGSALPNGSEAILPGDALGSVVHIRNQDISTLRVMAIRHDVHSTFLLTR